MSIMTSLFKRFISKDTRSKSARGLCKNDGCNNKHRTGSAYCQRCSDKWHRNKREFEGLFSATIDRNRVLSGLNYGDSKNIFKD